MGANTKIEWCDHTVNIVWGCEKVSLACANCYAETISSRFSEGRATWGKDGLRWVRSEEASRELLVLDRKARKAGVRRRVFINSMSDTFETRADLNAARNALFVVAANLTNLDLLLLTKRPENVMPMLGVVFSEIKQHGFARWKDRIEWDRVLRWLAGWLDGETIPANIWIGTTVENQEMLKPRHAALMAILAKVHFWSCEPLLSKLNCAAEWAEFGKPDWVICGGESGAGARPMHPDWARSLRDQCQAAGVPFLNVCRWVTPNGEAREEGDPNEDEPMYRVGKAAAGCLLDGREWKEFPEVVR